MTVTVSKEVAEAIEELRSNKKPWSNYNIIALLEDANYSVGHKPMKVLKGYFNATNPEHEHHPNVLMQALINGYTVENSPEDKIREYYERCWVNHGNATDIAMTRTAMYYDGQATGVRQTLDILGIKIEGVND